MPLLGVVAQGLISRSKRLSDGAALFCLTQSYKLLLSRARLMPIALWHPSWLR